MPDTEQIKREETTTAAVSKTNRQDQAKGQKVRKFKIAGEISVTESVTYEEVGHSDTASSGRAALKTVQVDTVDQSPSAYDPSPDCYSVKNKGPIEVKLNACACTVPPFVATCTGSDDECDKGYACGK